MTYDLRELTATVIAETYGVEITPVFTRPGPGHGDFATNVALQLAKQLNKAPIKIAEDIKKILATRGNFSIEIAGPGFINITLSDQEVYTAALQSINLLKPLEGKSLVVEYSDPNPFKVLHAGHLYTSLVGDAIANILQAAGAKVHRVNFGGDVGLHVAKSLWSIINDLGGEQPEKLKEIPNAQKLDWVGQLYAKGNQAYEEDAQAKQQITDINKRIYELHAKNDRESPFAQIYWTCRQWSYDGFKVLYDRLGMVPFEKYYPESDTIKLGIETVAEGLKKNIFKKSEGAVVYMGEHKGLHTRVFINSDGLPTYETKDLGLALTKWHEYQYDQSLIITDKSQQEYMKVVLAVVAEFNADASSRTMHLTHGQIKLVGGVKMSSRKGNFLRADDILDAAFAAGKKITGGGDQAVVLGAVRYSFLRGRMGGDIIFDPNESVSMEGNSGPYLQYALVRARSILRKIKADAKPVIEIKGLDEQERNLARAIGRYPEEFALALQEYSPHHIANYLYDLAVIFNRFYEQSRVVGHERAKLRTTLVRAYEQTLAHGLAVLGMPQPEKM